MSNKLMVVGLDGADWNLLTPWIEQGKLPTLGKMTKYGTWGPLKSTIPPLSAPAWTSAFTGVNPGKHNIFDFFKSKGYSIRLTNATDRKAKAVWEVLSERGLKVIVINVPMTYPPDKVNGIMISGKVGLGGLFLNKSADYTYPRKIQKKLSQIGYTMDKVPKKEDDYRLALEEVEIKRQIVLDFVQNQDWNLFVMIFTTPDHFQHLFWKYTEGVTGQSPYNEVVLNIYRAIDRILEQLDDMIGRNTNFILLSDHGFDTIEKFVYLNNWFRDVGLLKQIESDTHSRQIIPKEKSLLARLVSLEREVTDLIKDMTFFLPSSVKSSLRKVFRRKRLHIDMVLDASENIDWSKTKAWLQYSHGIVINVRGRQPLGIVELGKEYEDLRNTIIEKLSELTDPENGKKIIEKIYKREEIYHGPYTPNSPDLAVQPKAGYLLQTQTSEEKLFASPKIAGHHRPFGVFISYGPDIRKGYNIKNAEIIDIAPTILHMMGTPITKQMDGEVLTTIFDENSELYREPAQCEEFKERVRETRPKEIYTKEEEEEIKERLKRLGYL